MNIEIIKQIGIVHILGAVVSLCMVVLYLLYVLGRKGRSDKQSVSHGGFSTELILFPKESANISEAATFFKQEVDRLMRRLYGRLDLLAFFKSVPVLLVDPLYVSASYYDIEGKKVFLRTQQAYTLLHELLHAYWHLELPQDQRAKVAKLFQTEKKRYPNNREYYMVNVQEFWAGCATVYLAVKTTTAPFASANLAAMHGDMFLFLETILPQPYMTKEEKHKVASGLLVSVFDEIAK